MAERVRAMNGLRTGAVRGSTLVMVGLAAVTVGAVAVLTWPAAKPAQAPKSEQTPAPVAAKTLTVEKLEEIVGAAVTKSQQGEFAQAETILENAIKDFPRSQELYLALGQIKSGRDNAGAYESMKKAVAVGPSTGPVHYAAGRAALAAGLIDRAEEHFAGAIGAEPRTAEFHIALAEVYRRKNKFEEAIHELTKASNLDPNNPGTWASLADCSLQINRAQVAIGYVRKARELDARNGAWRLIEARALNRLGSAEEAVNVLAGLDGPERRQLAVLRVVSESYGLLGKPGDAARWWIDASDAVPTNVNLAYEGALAAKKGGKVDDAKRLADRAKVLGHPEAAALTAELAAAGEGK